MFVIRNRFPFRFTNVCPFPGTKYMTYTCAYYGCTYAYFYVRAYMTRIYMRTKKKVGTCIKCTHVLICTRIRQSLRAGVRRVFTSVFPCDVSKSNTMDGAESLRISHDDDDYDIILYARVPQSNGRDDRRWESYRARPSTGRGEGVGRRADTRPTAWGGEELGVRFTGPADDARTRLSWNNSELCKRLLNTTTYRSVLSTTGRTGHYTVL